MNKEIMLTLKLATIGQLYLEMLDEYEKLPTNTFKRRSLVKQLTKGFELDVVDINNKAFLLDQETLRIIEQSYDYGVTSLAKRDIPSAVIQSQFWAAFTKDPQGIESTVHRILKKK